MTTFVCVAEKSWSQTRGRHCLCQAVGSSSNVIEDPLCRGAFDMPRLKDFAFAWCGETARKRKIFVPHWLRLPSLPPLQLPPFWSVFGQLKKNNGECWRGMKNTHMPSSSLPKKM
ncbi:hypothetical protein TNCV_2423071 [Trichonephila clavipes]|nr:hypothetical protein TNCV_2423071 [Trichonephila clavipes]